MKIKISWQELSAEAKGGLTLDKYLVEIRDSNGDYIEYQTLCDGGDS